MFPIGREIKLVYLCRNVLVNICKRHASRSYEARILKKKKLEDQVIQYAGKNVKRADRTYVWGCAVTGALGVRRFVKPEKQGLPRKQQHVPHRLAFFDDIGYKVRHAACGYGFTVYVCDTGERHLLFGSGINTDSQLGYQEYPVNSGRVLDYVVEPASIELPLDMPTSTRVQHIACGRAHTLIVTDKEGVFTLGHNAYGQCGRPIVEAEIHKGSKIINKISLDKQFIQAECGQDHSLLLADDGSLYSCGLGADGQTGLGNYDCQESFSLVGGDVAGENITQVSSRADCVLAVNAGGDVFGWGNTEYNQLSCVAADTTQLHTPRHLPLPGIGKVKQVAAAGSMCALLNDVGNVWVWGYGLLGKGPRLEQTATPVQIPATLFGCTDLNPDTRVVDIQCGITHFAAITNRGDLYTWGRNRTACLGLGHSKDQFFPFKASVPAEVQTAVCGVDHMVVLTKAFA